MIVNLIKILKKKKKSPTNNQNSVSPGFNAAEHRDDFIDSAVFGLNGSNGTNVKLGSKKTNLNHLLNFTYESSKESNENYYEYENYSKQFWSTKFSKSSYFSKEQFLQAKYTNKFSFFCFCLFAKNLFYL